MPDSVLFVELGIDATNDDILDQMRIMKARREDRRYGHVVCTVRGFAGDERPLFEIPEVKAFCRRVVNIGFISYLDFTTTFDSSVPAIAKDAWGAAEVWLCGEGRLRNPENQREDCSEKRSISCKGDVTRHLRRSAAARPEPNTWAEVGSVSHRQESAWQRGRMRDFGE